MINRQVKRRITLEISIGVIVVLIFAYLVSRWESGDEKRTVSLSDPAVEASIKKNQEKLLIIGIDGATWKVALNLVGAGRMPNLERLLKQGAHGNLVSTPPLISPAIWTTFATGVPREVHGIDNFLYKIPFEYKLAQMGTRVRKVPALWNIFSQQGKRVGVVNWYAAQTAEACPGGVFVSPGIAPELVHDHQVWPPEWLDKIRNIESFRNPLMERKLEMYQHPVIQRGYDLDRFVAAIGAEILREKSPDLMMIYLRNVDVVSHGFWKYRFSVGLEYYYPVSEAERERFRDVIDIYYEFTDWLIGKLIEAAPGYTVMLLSDHGFEATYPPQNIFINLNRLLEGMGYLEFSGPTCEGILGDLWNKGELKMPPPVSYNIFFTCEVLKQVVRSPGGAELIAGFLLEHRMVEKAQLEKLWGQLDSLTDLLRRGHMREEVLWRRTRVFNMEDFHKDVQGLYINLDGREPEGVIPEKEFASFRKEVIRELSALRTESGKRVFTMVRANPDKGIMPMGELDPPDILLEFNRDVLGEKYIERRRGDDDPIPLSSILWSYEDVSGDHALEGIWLISGPDTAGFESISVTVPDIAPTVLWFFGFPLGADMPGAVIKSAFSTQKQNTEVLYVKTWSDLVSFRAEGARTEISLEKREQLKALGYIQH
jgi:predicted AlkP superfamily phosphohydrolase/phosphomutase